MAKCVHCAARKGKRRCPALGGDICSACCGEHRRITIACPDDCVWLAGGQLSIAPPPSASPSDRLRALHEKLQAFVGRNKRAFREAADEYTSFAAVPVPQDGMANLIGYALYGHRDCDDLRCIDRFRASESRRLRTDELETLSWLESAHFRLLEIKDVQLDEGFSARDLLRNEDIAIREKRGTHQLAPFGGLAAWIIMVDGHYELEGSSILVPRAALSAIVHEARACLSEPDTTPRVMDSLIPIIVHEELDTYLYQQQSNPPILHNTDGELVVLSVARYTLRDPDAARRVLASHAELRADAEDLYAWIDESYNEQLDGPTLLGRIHIEGDRLRLETNSRERHEDGRELLEAALGELIQHRADSFTDPQQAAQHAPPSSTPAALDTPEAREFLASFLQSKITAWVDESIPALGGKTPRQAAADPALRAQVIELVKDYEHMMKRNDPGLGVDFSVVWRELGLSPD